MRRLTMLIVLLAAAFAVAPHAAIHAQAAGASRSFAPGWNLIAVPPGTVITQAVTAVTLQPGDTDYQPLSPHEGSQSGFGYWAFFQARESVVLEAGSNDPYAVDAPPGQYFLIGNPSGVSPAQVLGADLVYTYDPATGYHTSVTLQPGQGAWVQSANGGTITVAPFTPAPAAPAPAPAPAPPAPAPRAVSLSGFQTITRAGYRFQVPSDWNSLSPAYPDDAIEVSPDANQSVILTVISAPPRPGLSAAELQGATLRGADGALAGTAIFLDDDDNLSKEYTITAIRGFTAYSIIVDFTESYDAAHPGLAAAILASFELV